SNSSACDQARPFRVRMLGRRDYASKRKLLSTRPNRTTWTCLSPQNGTLLGVDAAVRQSTPSAEENVMENHVSMSMGPAGWNSPRWNGITRTYSHEQVNRLRGTVHIEYSLARSGAEKLWRMFQRDPYVAALGALTGNQAVEMAAAGLQAIYLSGWQVAADANLSGDMYPDQSLYPVNSVPAVVRAINQALMRADQIAHSEDQEQTDWMLPIVADAEAGFGGVLNAFELMKSLIEAGAAAVHFEDQLSSAKKCGHMGGKVLVPTREAIQKLTAARLAADVL